MLRLGLISYEAYEPDGLARFKRVVGPTAKYFYHEHEWEWTSGEEISLGCRAALIVAEDPRFYRHFGIEPRSIWAALKHNYRNGKIIWGGSSITQQIVKNAFLDRQKSIIRKSRELLGALILDRIMTKEDQVTWYLNIAEFGPRIYGIGSAAKRYFDLSVKDLSLSQCISLFSVLPDPGSSYSSLIGGRVSERVRDRRAGILRTLARAGIITEDKLKYFKG